MPTDLRLLNIRTLFISDLHLGFRLANAQACLEMLRAVNPQQIYLVGDTIDAWRLVRTWHWPQSHDQVVAQLSAMQQSGVDIFLSPGNHDDCFRESAFTAGAPAASQKKLYQIALPILKLNRSESFIHETLDGKRLLVTHGDLFDDVKKRTAGISSLGRRIFDQFSGTLPDAWCHKIRHFFKSVLARPNKIERRLINEAQSQRLDGLVYGHVHRPAMSREGEFIVVNTGDWVENQSLLVELDNGKLELINFGQTIATMP